MLSFDRLVVHLAVVSFAKIDCKVEMPCWHSQGVHASLRGVPFPKKKSTTFINFIGNFVKLSKSRLTRGKMNTIQ